MKNSDFGNFGIIPQIKVRMTLDFGKYAIALGDIAIFGCCLLIPWFMTSLTKGTTLGWLADLDWVVCAAYAFYIVGHPRSNPGRSNLQLTIRAFRKRHSRYHSYNYEEFDTPKTK